MTQFTSYKGEKIFYFKSQGIITQLRNIKYPIGIVIIQIFMLLTLKTDAILSKIIYYLLPF